MAYKKAIELNPKLASAYNNLAVAYYYKKDYGNAWKVIERARRQGLGKAIREPLKIAFVARTSEIFVG